MPRLEDDDEQSRSSCCLGGILPCFTRNATPPNAVMGRSATAFRYQSILSPSLDTPPPYEACMSEPSESYPQDKQELEGVIKQALNDVTSELRTISLDLHKNVEISLEETHAHALLTDYLERKGFTITRHAYGMQTAFVAEYSRGTGRRVGVCAEYDGLPGLGQGCGHNLIAIAGVAVAISIKTALEQGHVSGKVVLFGTPAEELSVGKIRMVEQRAFQDNVDVCVMLHPGPYDAQYANMIAVTDVHVEFIGVASHASASPWEGVNALDAMVQLWNNISMMRQQLLPTDRVHGIVTDGGQAPNVIPEHTQAHFFVRTTQHTQLERVMTRMEQCFRSSALATGCKVKWTWREIGPTKDVAQNEALADLYAKHMEMDGVQFQPRSVQFQWGGGSTDMGNVSYEVPSLHPFYSIHSKAANHTVDFTEAAATEKAHEDTMRASKAMALTALEVLRSKTFYEAVRQKFDTHAC